MELDTNYLKYGIVKDKSDFPSGAEALGLAAQALYESAIKLGPLTRVPNARVTCDNLFE
jgi:hypothetical protein